MGPNYGEFFGHLGQSGTAQKMSGLPVDSPLPLFWDCKNSPGFVINGLKLSMCFGMKLYVLCDLIWCGVEINRLMLNED